MKILADYDRCEGHGLCAEQATALFDLDDDGELTHHFEGAVPDDQVDAGRRAIDACPVAELRQA